MNEFVEECRSEWKRLGVADLVADEMAAELVADLEEAEAEGASADEVLGAGAFDPAAFAAAWAAERGVIGRPPPNGQRPRRSWPVPAAILALALIAVVGAVLVIVVSPSARDRQTLLPPPVRVALEVVSPDGQTIAALSPSAATQEDAAAQASGQRRATLWVARDDATTTILGGDRGDSEDNTRTIGSVVLIAGLVGIVLLSLWEWFGRGRSSRQGTNVDDPPGGSAY